MVVTFEEYWETKGSRIQTESHEERARLAWEAGYEARKRMELAEAYNARLKSNEVLCGLSFDHPVVIPAYQEEDDLGDYQAGYDKGVREGFKKGMKREADNQEALRQFLMRCGSNW